MEIPKEIKFEFFLIFTGLFFLILPSWLYFWQVEIFKKILNNNLLSVSLVLLSTSGFVLFITGFRELVNNYFMNKDILVREYRLKRFELDKNLKTLPPEYLENIKFPTKKKKIKWWKKISKKKSKRKRDKKNRDKKINLF